MSTMIMSACWPLSMPPTPKAVLISLADNANDHGECWPSVARICERTCFSERAVHRAIAWLEESGVLLSDRVHGRSTRFSIKPECFKGAEPPQMRHPRISGTPADAAPQPPQMRQEPPQMRHPTPADAAPRTVKEPSRTVRSNRQEGSPEASLLNGLPPRLVTDYLAVRKAKKSPLTETAVAGLKREAAKAGLSLEAAVTVCCERGWAGFKADWHARDLGGFGNAPRRANGAQPEILPEMEA